MVLTWDKAKKLWKVTGNNSVKYFKYNVEAHQYLRAKGE